MVDKVKQRDITVIYVPEAHQQVRKKEISRSSMRHVTFFILLSVVFLIVLPIYLHMNSVSEISSILLQKDSDKKRYEFLLSNKDQTIETLHTHIVELSEQAAKIEQHLDELKTLERNVRILSQDVHDTDPMDLEKTASNHHTVGLGGAAHSASDHQMQHFIDQTRKSIASLKEDSLQLSDQLTEMQYSLEERHEELQKIPSIWPAESVKVSSSFGIRRDPFTQKAVFHNGIDIPGHRNDPIYAAASGLIEEIGTDLVQGNYVYIDHLNGYKTVYLHLNQIEVNQGDTVTKGDTIGLMGSTGRSTGVHLHYEVHKDGTPINPNEYIPN